MAQSAVMPIAMVRPPSAQQTGSTDLRNARKAFTRAHICAAARQIFIEKGYVAATMEQIGQAAGAPRSTLYSHFSDKEQILDAIADDYIERLNSVLALVPCPQPTLADIRRWIDTLAQSIRDDRIPTILFNGIGIGLDMPHAVRRIGDSVMQVLAGRLEAFALALREGPEQAAYRAGAQVAVRELSYCCQSYAILNDDEAGPHYLDVAAQIFHQFTQRPNRA